MGRSGFEEMWCIDSKEEAVLEELAGSNSDLRRRYTYWQGIGYGTVHCNRYHRKHWMDSSEDEGQEVGDRSVHKGLAGGLQGARGTECRRAGR